jgi:hypothetical protein
MLDQALILTIPSNGIQDHSNDDLEKLLVTYSLAEKARDDFLARELTFDEYIMLLESAQLNIDLYLETVESNLETMQLI